MEQELTVEIGAPREAVWQALAGDLARRGRHVRVLVERAPEELRLLTRVGPGERLLLGYRLIPLSELVTAVEATVSPQGAGYALKRMLTFGAVERGYVDALAVGLANLQRHLQAEDTPAGPA